MDLQLIELFHIEPAELDGLLALGWFRIQQTIFTTNSLNFNGEEYEAIWLRVDLSHFQPDKKCKALIKRNGVFKTQIVRATITPQLEALYESYKKSISFQTAPTLQWLLFGNSGRNVYDTYIINIHDGDKLIAAGFFDLGGTSAAGICTFYDPSYKKYSPGKYMIYQKMLYCKEQNLKYFYPGYFVPGYPMFDYKLEIGKPSIEYLDMHSKEWRSVVPSV